MNYKLTLFVNHIALYKVMTAKMKIIWTLKHKMNIMYIPKPKLSTDVSLEIITLCIQDYCLAA